MIFILQSVSYGAHTFTDIRLAIGEANTKILSDRLAELVEMKLLTKDTESRYDLSDRGRELAQKMKKLAEWWGSTYPKE